MHTTRWQRHRWLPGRVSAANLAQKKTRLSRAMAIKFKQPRQTSKGRQGTNRKHELAAYIVSFIYPIFSKEAQWQLLKIKPAEELFNNTSWNWSYNRQSTRNTKNGILRIGQCVTRSSFSFWLLESICLIVSKVPQMPINELLRWNAASHLSRIPTLCEQSEVPHRVLIYLDMMKLPSIRTCKSTENVQERG